jgi:hypothetical protein
MRWNKKTPSNYNNITRQGDHTFSNSSAQERERVSTTTEQEQYSTTTVAITLLSLSPRISEYHQEYLQEYQKDILEGRAHILG